METDLTNKTVKREEVWIIKINLYAFIFNNDAYLLFLAGDIDKPLLLDKKLCVYTKESMIDKLSNIGILILNSNVLEEVDFTINISQVLKLITLNSIDNNAVIINALNTAFDVLNALEIDFPKDYKSILFSFADHLTFNRRYGAFFVRNNLSRRQLIEATSWLLETIFRNVVFC
ncbi:hypothetical protein [Mucilaginibacter gilvus]|uniref:Uncharacterized protein n=1 Tax=Mucilaginibacter gilvus TaxID=2305909 RepID=A0A3S3UQU3_9SPHI|nr:hypothetical protein [Mucilaginibacter gilvus]RWY48555.1 hypothetical protein EPL05_19100 [Mucilaginibacter gilvus]